MWNISSFKLTELRLFFLKNGCIILSKEIHIYVKFKMYVKIPNFHYQTTNFTKQKEKYQKIKKKTQKSP